MTTPPAAILILTPLLLPIVQAVGVSPIHFGIIMAVNLSIGMYTPPFGLNLFTSQAVFDAALGKIYVGVLTQGSLAMPLRNFFVSSVATTLLNQALS